MEREACVCDHGYERSDLCAEIIIIIIIIALYPYICSHQRVPRLELFDLWRRSRSGDWPNDIYNNGWRAGIILDNFWG